MGMTYVQKLLARACGKAAVVVGDVLEPPVHLAMSHENGALVISQFNEIFQGTGREPKVWDPERIAIIFDHRVPAESSKTATNQKEIREFVARQGITKFHDIRGDAGTPDRLSALRGQCQADRRSGGEEGAADRGRLVHQRPPRRPRGGGGNPQRQAGGRPHPHAGLPGLVAHLLGGAAPGLSG